MTADDILAAALQYAQRGWVIHRLHSPHSKESRAPGKAPVDAGWTKKSEPPSEHQIRKWFTSENDYSVGLLCGRVSGVTVIDVDDTLFMYGVDVSKLDTLMSARTKGRGHIFFKYNPNLKSCKHHDLGIEVLNDGNNAVLPPSTHTSGDVYRWRDPDADLAEMPRWFEDWLLALFEADTRLKRILGKCRPCFRLIFKDRRALNFHGATGREGMLALCTELVANGAAPADIQFLAKINTFAT